MKENQIQKIEELVEEVYRLRPSISDSNNQTYKKDEISAFEEQHHIILPESYKYFVLKFSGALILPRIIEAKILPLAESLQNHIYKSFSGSLNEDFPYFGDFPIKLKWDNEKDKYIDSKPLRGTLCLGSEGCDLIWLLVLSGKESGKVWRFAPTGEYELIPTKLDFFEWCILNLKEKIDIIKTYNEKIRKSQRNHENAG